MSYYNSIIHPSDNACGFHTSVSFEAFVGCVFTVEVFAGKGELCNGEDKMERSEMMEIGRRKKGLILSGLWSKIINVILNDLTEVWL